jgi:N-acetylneuraminate synthase/N,N'-diacetyllegionaminate synthase
MGHSFNEEIRIGERVVGKGHPIFIIAEAGVAHFGSLNKARKLVDLAASAGADAVKFQVFQTAALVSSACPEWRRRLASRELPLEAIRDIRDYCIDRGIPFFATAHDLESLDWLDELGVCFYKVGSGEVRNWSYLEEIARRGKPVFLSTGMYTLDDVARALGIFAEAGNADLVVLHCVTSYPTPVVEVNLRAMDTIREVFRVITGYSDHTQGFHVPLAAAARGAKVLEKHISLDFNVPDAQDWKVSCGPHDFKTFVDQVREVEASLGSGIKVPSPAEKASLVWARKSLVAARRIPAGTIITLDDLTCKRPGTGIAPSEMNVVLGRTAEQDIPEDTLIQPEMLR